MADTTFAKISGFISNICDIETSEITPESNAVDELGVDSVDFLDVVFEIDRHFGIKLPVESWVEEINAGKAKTDDYFVLARLVEQVDRLVSERRVA